MNVIKKAFTDQKCVIVDTALAAEENRLRLTIEPNAQGRDQRYFNVVAHYRADREGAERVIREPSFYFGSVEDPIKAFPSSKYSDRDRGDNGADHGAIRSSTADADRDSSAEKWKLDLIATSPRIESDYRALYDLLIEAFVNAWPVTSPQNYASTVKLILRSQGVKLDKSEPVEELSERLTEESRKLLHAELTDFITTNVCRYAPTDDLLGKSESPFTSKKKDDSISMRVKMVTERDAHKQEARFSENSAVRFRDLEVMRLEDVREKMRVIPVAPMDVMSALCAPPSGGGEPKRGNAPMHFGFAVVKLGQVYFHTETTFYPQKQLKCVGILPEGAHKEDGPAGSSRSFFDVIQEAHAAGGDEIGA
ncbi:hypothetical protein CYMTET_16834 [Cymbomonas tetramitiformis]|uniref:Uncharacterized protein n=1 Tax=Cymbomonas tetramitiformis TaxID=36881 RepID=A0AAE0BR80_9CHLO|nr:hypothetical protein CYMTET_49756 [Cymbomonas tetramitiformis]KAK3275014.1 hypothetical protein CYMTET_16834 [Cymbomonas tetramitiformis]